MESQYRNNRSNTINQYRNNRRNRINQSRNYREQIIMGIDVDETANNINNINQALDDILYNDNELPQSNINDLSTQVLEHLLGDDTYIISSNNDIIRHESIVDRDRFERLFYMIYSQIRRLPNEEPISRKFNITTHTAVENNTQIEIECNICYELNENTKFIKLNCNHEFCKECVKNVLKSCYELFNTPCCAYCRTEITDITYKNETIHEPSFHLYGLEKLVSARTQELFNSFFSGIKNSNTGLLKRHIIYI
jgi:hypothetical protein